MYKKNLYVFFILFFIVNLSINALEKDLFQKKYINTNWFYSNGFPANSALDVIQNDEEYIWAATYDGLIRFDGKDFKLFNKYTDKGYSALSATRLFEDSKKRLWVATNESGVLIYKMGKFTNLSMKDGLNSNIVRAIKEDKKGNIFIGTAKGLVKLWQDEKSEKWVMKTIFSDVDVINLEIINNDGIVAITNSGEILSYMNGKKENIFSDKNFLDYKYQTILKDSNNNIWLGTTSGEVVKINNFKIDKIYKNEDIFSINSILELKRVNGKTYIVFCSDKGIGVFDPLLDKFDIFDETNGIINNSIEKVFIDKEDNIWLASKRVGLQKLTPSKFTNYSEITGLSYNIINTIAKDKASIYWLGSDKGLSLIKNGQVFQNEITELLKDIRIRHIMSDSKGNIWISTYSDMGVLKINDLKYTSINSNNGLSSNKVRVTFEDSKKRIWIGTTGGLNLLENIEDKNFKIKKDFKNLKSDYIMCIEEDKEGNICVGSDGQGIYIINKNYEVKNITKNDGLAGDVIFKIFKDKDNNIWIATNEGVSLYKNNKFYNFDSKDGFVADSIFQIIEENNMLWFTSSKGVFAIKKESLIKDAEKSNRNLNIEKYGLSDGLLDSSTANSWGINDGNGKLWFPTLNGVSVFDRKNVSLNKKNPKIIFQYIDIDGIKYSFGEINKIKAGTKRIKIKFTALSFQIPQKVKFKYYLEGFDSDWSEETTEREVVYTNLPYGKYTFYIKAANNDGIWTKEPYSFTFYREPFFYETIIFKIFVILLAIIFTAIGFSYKIKILKEKRKHISKTLEDTITALTSAIDAKDSYTKGHSLRVAEISEKIGKELNIKEEELTRLKYSALLHDIGKIGVDDNILRKKGILTDIEFENIKQHPFIGGNILDKDSLKQFYNGAKYHHERYDGKGYCCKLNGENIPLEARIIAVADVYDAITSDRPYRKGRTTEEAVEEINRISGTQLDPKIVEIFNRLIKNKEIE